MGTELQIALIAGGFSLLATLLSLRNDVRSRRALAEIEKLRIADERRFEKEKSVARYREPLARAAYDLQSRIYNIVRQGLIDVYFTRGDKREQLYVVENTTFLFAQYFAWTEIIRKQIQVLDLGEDEQTRRLAHLQDDIHSQFLRDDWGPAFRIFAGEQRAIGEKMIRESSVGSECIGYATFLESHFGKLEDLFDCIRQDVRTLRSGTERAEHRLIAVQHSLIDLLVFLDPTDLRFPPERRTKLTV